MTLSYMYSAAQNGPADGISNKARMRANVWGCGQCGRQNPAWMGTWWKVIAPWGVPTAN